MPSNFKMKNIYFLFRCFPTSLAPTCRVFFLSDHTQPQLLGRSKVNSQDSPRSWGEEDGAGAPSQGGQLAGGPSERGEGQEISWLEARL
jgi:hypothetical protein